MSQSSPSFVLGKRTGAPKNNNKTITMLDSDSDSRSDSPMPEWMSQHQSPFEKGERQ